MPIDTAHAVLIVDHAGWHTTDQTFDPDKHHSDAFAAKVPGTEPRGKHLAVHARQLDVQPYLQLMPGKSLLYAVTPGTD